jgi:glucosyl-3-phosphoglycerate synthase
VLSDDVGAWFAARTTTADEWPLERLLERKGATRVSVVLPALDEEATVGRIVESVCTSLGEGAPAHHRLVDELVVVDSGSTDRTAEVARAAGARVVHRDEILPDLPAVHGKGEAMWRSLAATDGDVLVFVDADLQSFTPAYVTGLLGPLLCDPQVQLVKAVYERPLVEGSAVMSAGGGRVTELVARPLLNLLWPQLAGVVQPLAGEYAARRSLLEQLSFPCGYGVELGLLVDTLDLVGLSGLAQVDLGVRVHRHHDERRLGQMAAEIMGTALDRLERRGDLTPQSVAGHTLTQFERGSAGFISTTRMISSRERPPMASVSPRPDLRVVT